MHLPEAARAGEHEAIFRSGQKGVDDAVAAIKKIQMNAKELRDATEELRRKYGA